MDRVRFEKLRWKCRRGLLELDLILQKFLEKNLTPKDLDPLSELLDLPDNDLWDVVSGRSDRYDGRFDVIVARLRAC